MRFNTELTLKDMEINQAYPEAIIFRINNNFWPLTG
jgi:hypothetical protein